LAYFSQLQSSPKSKYSNEQVKAALDSNLLVEAEDRITKEEEYFQLLIDSDYVKFTSFILLKDSYLRVVG